MKVREYERDKNRKKAGGGGAVLLSFVEVISMAQEREIHGNSAH